MVKHSTNRGVNMEEEKVFYLSDDDGNTREFYGTKEQAETEALKKYLMLIREDKETNDFIDVWCNQCKRYVQPVDRNGSQKHFDYGAFCEECGDQVSVVENPVEASEGCNA